MIGLSLKRGPRCYIGHYDRPIPEKRAPLLFVLRAPQVLKPALPGSQVGVIMREDCAVARLSCHVRWPVSLGLLP